jgi:two-component system response regulator
MNVLLVEDSADDIAAIRRLAEGSRPPITLTVVHDGEEASAYLSGRGRLGSDELPHLILLDMRLPGIGGIEVLQRIKRAPDFCEIPVVVLTGSDRDEDVREAVQLGAHSYIVKPMTAQYFAWIARSIASYRARLARIGKESP